MLTMSKDSSSLVNIVGIDPGSNTLGLSMLTVDITKWEIISSDAVTFTGTKLENSDSWRSDLFSERVGRIAAHEENLLKVFNTYKPFIICTESPFINNRFPQAGIALTEVMCGIRSAVMKYDVWADLYLIDPPTVKKAVGAPGNADKVVMKEKILSLTELNYIGNVPMEMLDEHSIDALAVAYCKFIRLKLCYKLDS